MIPFDSTAGREPRLPGDDFAVPFDEAIAWARERRAVLPAEFYGARLQAVRARGFAIAGLAALDQVQQVADSLAEATASGTTFRDWQKTLPPDVFALGRARRELIFRNAVQTHYGIGRTIQQRENAAARPYLMWDAINDSRTRPTHRAMDNHIGPVDDPIWKRWTPPAGHQCRCTRISLTEAQARARGYPKLAPDVEPDAGWEGDPTEGNEDLLRVIRARQASCLTTFAAKGSKARKLSCDDSPAMEKLLQAASELDQGGAFPSLKAPYGLTRLDAAQYSQGELYQRFAAGVDSRIEQARWASYFDIAIGPDKSFFLKQDGDWKITKNARAQWIDFLADTLIDPAEARLVTGGNAPDELQLLGGFATYGAPLFTLLALRYVGRQWVGVSAFQLERWNFVRYRQAGQLVWRRK